MGKCFLNKHTPLMIGCDLCFATGTTVLKIIVGIKFMLYSIRLCVAVPDPNSQRSITCFLENPKESESCYLVHRLKSYQCFASLTIHRAAFKLKVIIFQFRTREIIQFSRPVFPRNKTMAFSASFRGEIFSLLPVAFLLSARTSQTAAI